MKKIILASALALAGLAANATALSASPFNVIINLTSACVITTQPSNITLNYTSFAAGPATGTTTAGVKCTGSLPYTVALDQTTTLDDAVNLNYSTSVLPASGTGTGLAQTHTITAAITVPQAGTCATATCDNSAATNRTRTLTVTY